MRRPLILILIVLLGTPLAAWQIAYGLWGLYVLSLLVHRL